MTIISSCFVYFLSLASPLIYLISLTKCPSSAWPTKSLWPWFLGTPPASPTPSDFCSGFMTSPQPHSLLHTILRHSWLVSSGHMIQPAPFKTSLQRIQIPASVSLSPRQRRQDIADHWLLSCLGRNRILYHIKRREGWSVGIKSSRITGRNINDMKVGEKVPIGFQGPSLWF